MYAPERAFSSISSSGSTLSRKIGQDPLVSPLLKIVRGKGGQFGPSNPHPINTATIA
jgi:hypothetical protein